MINGKLRPWGRPEWLFQMNALRAKEWFLIGCISTQDRCKSILIHNPRSLSITRAAFIEIIDEPSIFYNESQAKIIANRAEVIRFSPPGSEIIEFNLLEPLLRLRNKVADWVAASNGSVVLDISTFPERFCFPILRWLMESTDVKDLILTYMIPEQYTKDDLGYDSQDWGQLPTFVNHEPFSKATVEHVIVGVGFLPYSLPDWLKKTYDNPNFTISLFLPFPSAPSNVNRAWEFVRRIENDLKLKSDRQIIRVSAHDMCGVFQRIEGITRSGQSPAVFAPYGPKAHSMAMCLHALRNSSEVYFTQPTYYHPNYSTGISINNGLPAGYSYIIRLNSADYY